ncbi:MAG: helix-turn-helix transcriptional regulator [Erysipelotrichaceae bacterium]|nr:helix-turn-helix transcriptional regulator [Erysipelotrichaceae bacterium]
MDYDKTGALIKKLREGRNISQKDLARKLHVTSAAVSKWENGKGFPDVSLLDALSSELGVSVTELINGEKSGNEDAAIKSLIMDNKAKKRKYILLNILVLCVILLAVRELNKPEKEFIENAFGFTLMVPYTVKELSMDPDTSEDIFCYYSHAVGLYSIPTNKEIAKTTRIRKFSQSYEEFTKMIEELKKGNYTFHFQRTTDAFELFCYRKPVEKETYVVQLQFLNRDEAAEIEFINMSLEEIIGIINSIEPEK